MIYKTIFHPVLQRHEVVPTGFSGTAFFFGCFVPLFRGDFKWFAISAAVCIFGVFMFGIPTLVMWVWLMVSYNDAYLLDKVKQGWVISEGHTVCVDGDQVRVDGDWLRPTPTHPSDKAL